MPESHAIPESIDQKRENSPRIPDEIEPPHLSDALARSEIGSALLKHFSKYGDIYVRPREL